MPSRFTARLIRAAGDAIAARSKGSARLCILNYHRVLEAPHPLLSSEPHVQAFRWQIELLAECFNVMSLHDAVLALTAGDLPPRAVCISFDDGYRSVHDLALPIMKEFNVPATVFVSSGYVGQGNMWNDRIIESVQILPSQKLDLRDIGLGMHSLNSIHDRKRTAHALIEASKYQHPDDRLALAQRLEAMAGKNSSRCLMLTPQMVVNLAHQGIEIGGHTVSHPILTRLEDESARYEITAGKQQLEAITGKPVRFFAYPNGKTGRDFDERHIRMVKEAGFSAAFTTSVGAASRKHNRFALPRSCPWDANPLLFGLRLMRWLAS